MAKILRLTDRVKLTVGDVSFYLAPYTWGQKMEMSNCTYTKSGQAIVDTYKIQILMLKYGIKNVEGIDDFDLKFDADGNLTDESISELLYLEQTTKMINAAYEIHNGLPDKIETEGVALEIIKSKTPDS